MTDGNFVKTMTTASSGGLHLLQISGPDVPEFLGDHFRRRGSRHADPEHGELFVGDEILDEILLHRHQGAGGADLGLHGSPAVYRRVLDLLQDRGFETVDRVVTDPALGPSLGAPALEFEARSALKSAWSQQAALFFASALEGRLVREVQSLSSHCESPQTVGHPGLGERIESLLARAPFGVAMASPPRVLVFGATNAGKSTLVNRLCRSERVITGGEEGTTRDLIESPVEIEFYPFRLLDSAGEREALDPVEREGIARARKAREEADITVELLDGLADPSKHPEPCDDQHSGALCPARIIAVNKADQLDEAARNAWREKRPAAIFVSALNGAGVSRLQAEIRYRSAFAASSVRDGAVPFTQRQVSCLESALAALPADGVAAARFLRSLLGD